MSRVEYNQNPDSSEDSATTKEEILQKIKSSFLSSTSLHGMNQLLQTRSKWLRCFWKLVITCCSVGFIVHTIILMFEIQNSPKITTTLTAVDSIQEAYSARDKTPPLFPAVTVCTRLPFQKGTVDLKYLSIALGYPFISLNYKELSAIVDAIRTNQTEGLYWKIMGNTTNKMHFSGNLREYIIKKSLKCNELFLKCSLPAFETSCCNIFKPILTSYGMCFTFSPNETMQKDLYGYDIFAIDLHLSSDLVELAGVVVSIHDPREYPSSDVLKGGIGIWSGMSVTSKFTLFEIDYTEIYSLMEGNLFSDCNYKTLDIWEKPYTKNNCQEQTRMEVIKEVCDCVTVTAPYANSSNNNSVRFCGPQDFTGCVIVQLSNILRKLRRCNHLCKEYKYDTYTTFTELSPSYNVKRINRENAARVKMMYRELSYQKLQYKTRSISSTISKIGGTLGLMLGASAITLLEVLIFVVRYLWVKVAHGNVMKKIYQKNCS
ncbi:bile acid-sensitive ion channel-like [Tachypleus tridentatus]|uniref:bile acid-sensitive ion channel-like n=1 Tax=Tachypleus tridentatus TaxID=6853 RepID=UPI003FCFD7B3